MYKVILNFGEGALEKGYSNIFIQLWNNRNLVLGQWTGGLSANSNLKFQLEDWQNHYSHYYQNFQYPTRLEIEASGPLNSRKRLQKSCEDLCDQFNSWLETESFPSLDQQLQQFHLSISTEIQVLIVSTDPQLRLLPWHCWSFFVRYSRAWFTFGLPTFRRDYNKRGRGGGLKILSILGCARQTDESTINLEADRLAICQLPHIQELQILEEPTRLGLSDHLWDQGWDILVFSGHSQTESDQGYIRINANDRLSLKALSHALRQAVEHGLQLAVFNSCNGLGLATQLEELLLPQVIVMKEVVPDVVASTFLKYFVSAFSQDQHKPIYLALREAQERLAGLERSYPCASWLPALCQNPAIAPLTWATLRQLPVAPQHPFPTLKRVIVSCLVVTGLMMGGRWLGLLETWELAAYDHLMQSRPAETIDPRILMVTITAEETAPNQYGYPIEDAVLAQLLETLEQYRPRAIGLDLHRQQPRGQGRQDFIRQLQRHPNRFIVCSRADSEQAYGPPPELSAAQLRNQVGFSDLLIDTVDEVVRRQLLSYRPNLSDQASQCITPFSFSLHLAAKFFVTEGVQVTVNPSQSWQFGRVALPRIKTRFGGYQSLDGKSNQILINYRQTQLPAKQVTLTQILAGNIAPEEVRDRIVLIGYTAPIARDTIKTPHGSMTGVLVHAHMLSQILSAVQDKRPQIWVLPHWRDWQWGDWLWCWAWSSLGGGIVWMLRARSTLLLELSTVGLLGGLYLVCRVMLTYGAWLPLLPAAMGTLATTNSLIIIGFYRAHHQKKT